MKGAAAAVGPLVTTTRLCPVCGNDSAELISSQRLVVPAGYSLVDRFDVVCCDRCGAGFADTPVPQRTYERLYADESRYAAGPAAHADSDRDLERFREVARAIAGVVARRDARIADIGCANGLLLRALAERGFTNLFGIDPSRECVAQAARIPAVTAAVGSLSEIPTGSGPFDVVILSHVLEHVRDVSAALKYVRGFLVNDGFVYAEVPDASRYADFTWSPFQDFNTEHINHLTVTCLRNLFNSNGLQPAESGQKSILSAPDMPYPAAFCFATVGARDDRQGALCKDTALSAQLRRYTDVSNRLLKDIDDHLRNALPPGSEVVVWGTGELTYKLLAATSLATMKIARFVDANPVNHGRVLRGVPITPPADLTGSEALPIVVGSVLHARGIIQDIGRLGLSNRIVPLTT